MAVALLGQSLQGGYAPQSRPSNNPVQFSSNTQTAAPRQQAKTLGNFIGNQQADARQAYDDGGTSGESADDPSSQPSVLDAMRTQEKFPSSDSADEEDANSGLTPGEEVRKKDRDFQARDKAAAQRGEQFISPNAASGEPSPSEQATQSQPSAGRNQSPSLNVRQVPAGADYQQMRDVARIQALQRQTPPVENPNPAQQAMNVKETASEMVEWVQRGRKILLFFTGAGTITTLIEQNVLVANRMLLDGAVQIPFMGGRPPGAYERNPGLRKIDRADLFLAGIIDVSAIVMIFLSIMSFLITILPYVLVVLGAAIAGEFFGTIGADLYTQLAN